MIELINFQYRYVYQYTPNKKSLKVRLTVEMCIECDLLEME